MSLGKPDCVRNDVYNINQKFTRPEFFDIELIT